MSIVYLDMVILMRIGAITLNGLLFQWKTLLYFYLIIYLFFLGGGQQCGVFILLYLISEIKDFFQYFNEKQ